MLVAAAGGVGSCDGREKSREAKRRFCYGKEGAAKFCDLWRTRVIEVDFESAAGDGAIEIVDRILRRRDVVGTNDIQPSGTIVELKSKVRFSRTSNIPRVIEVGSQTIGWICAGDLKVQVRPCDIESSDVA